MSNYIDVELYTKHGGKNKKGVGYTSGAGHDWDKFSGLEQKEIDWRNFGADSTSYGRKNRNHQKESW